MAQLPTICKKVLFEEAINEINRLSEPKQRSKWRVLVVDNFSMKVISSCCSMQDLAANGITIVEDLHKNREPLQLEAIYLITPNTKSVKALLRDLDATKPMYQAFYIYPLERIPEKLFDEICRSTQAKRIRALKEINLSFIAFESNVFLLDSSHADVGYFFNTQLTNKPLATVALEQMAEQISTFCSTLKEFPSIRFRGAHSRMAKLAHLVEQKMESYRKSEHNSENSTQERNHSQLILIDRGFDCISPVLHELTMQAMAHDVLDVESNVYSYKGKSGEMNKVFLDNDGYWNEIKHIHMAEATLKVPEDYKKFMESKDVKGNTKCSVKDLTSIIQKMPHYQKKLKVLNTHLNLADECMTAFRRIEKLCSVEQDLATGKCADGDKVKDPLSRINPILLSPSEDSFTTCEKLRVLLLYVLSKNGVNKESLEKMFLHAGIDLSYMSVISNLEFLGFPPYQMGRKDPYRMERILREKSATKYALSRWVPVVKDVIELALEDKLDQRLYPYRTAKPAVSLSKLPISPRYGSWHSKLAGVMSKQNPKLIIFIVGGVTYSEIRSVYEINTKNKNWNVIIGSNYTLTPNSFLDQLKTLGE